VRVFRISRTAHSKDLTGEGARIHGGRWNHRGISVVYASESRALATTEYLVHLPMALVPDDLSIVTIRIPDIARQETIKPSTLPFNWRTYPAPKELADIGSRWARERRCLVLRVPSVVVQGDFNILINPDHPDIVGVKILAVTPYELDKRLLYRP
jgi:RES domain-containing protein